MWTLPLPAKDLLSTARRRLTSRYATGVYSVLWETQGVVLPDAHAIVALIRAIRTTVRDREVVNGTRDLIDASAEPQPPRRWSAPDALDVGAALLALAAFRQDVDYLECSVLDAAMDMGVTIEAIAAVLDMPVEELAERHEWLAERPHPEGDPIARLMGQANWPDGPPATTAEAADT